MSPNDMKIDNVYQVLNPDFVEWLIRKEMFFTIECPDTPPEVERAATIIYNWFSTHDDALPLPDINEWYAEMKNQVE